VAMTDPKTASCSVLSGLEADPAPYRLKGARLFATSRTMHA
jgi:hypothetical protein